MLKCCLQSVNGIERNSDSLVSQEIQKDILCNIGSSASGEQQMQLDSEVIILKLEILWTRGREMLLEIYSNCSLQNRNSVDNNSIEVENEEVNYEYIEYIHIISIK